MHSVTAEGEPLSFGAGLKEDKFAVLKEDNLQVIEGIGPKMNEILIKNGIVNWADLAAKSPEEVRAETIKMVREFGDKSRVIWSCGGGMPPNVTTENILAFKKTIDETVK